MARRSDSKGLIYSFIQRFSREHDYPPTVREICAGVGLSSPATVHAHLKTLEKEGLIRSDLAKQRSICVVRDSRQALTHKTPIVGTVAAGTPILAVENIEGYVELPEDMLHGEPKANKAFLLTVRGESMIDAGIQSGDKIIVRSDFAVYNGEIGVFRVIGENAITVKRVFYENDTVRLQPENSAMQPIVVASDAVEVVGKVIGLYRSY